MKELKDYLHLYLGCEVIYKSNKYHLEGFQKHGIDYGGKWIFIMNNADDGVWVDIKDIKPILRPLSDMTEEEARHFKVTKGIDRNLKTLGGSIWTFDEVGELLSKHFDLFGLIEAGLAIDKTTL